MANGNLNINTLLQRGDSQLQEILKQGGLGVGDIGKTQTSVAGTNVGDELAIAQSIGQTSNPLLGLLKGEQIFKAREKATRKGEVEEVLNQIKVAQAEVLQQKNQLENLKKADDAASRVAEQNAVLVGQNLNQAASLGDTAAGNAKVVDALIAGGRKPIGNVRWDRNTGMISGTFLVPDGAGGQTETPLTFRASDLVNSPEAKQALNLTIAGGNEQLLTARQELAAAPTAGQARLAEVESVLGREATEGERAVEAGVLRREETGEAGAFSSKVGDKATLQTIDAVRATERVNDVVGRAKELVASNPKAVTAGASLEGLVRTVGTNISSIADSIPRDSAFGFVPEILSDVQATGDRQAFQSVLADSLADVDSSDNDIYRLKVLETTLGYVRARAADPSGKISDADLKANMVQLTGFNDPRAILAQLDEIEKLGASNLETERRILQRVSPESARGLAPRQGGEVTSIFEQARQKGKQQ